MIRRQRRSEAIHAKAQSRRERAHQEFLEAISGFRWSGEIEKAIARPMVGEAREKARLRELHKRKLKKEVAQGHRFRRAV